MVTTILLGPPGAGKGTQTEKLIERYVLEPVFLGCLMRDHIQRGTEIGKQIACYVNEGLLAPHDVALNLIEESIKAVPTGSHLLFDGFPRDIDQTLMLDSLLGSYSYQIQAVILLEVPDDVIRERIKKRAILLGRMDDQTDEKVAKRIEIYHHETMEVIGHYEKKGKLYRVQAVGTISEVFGRITDIMDRFYEVRSNHPVV